MSSQSSEDNDYERQKKKNEEERREYLKSQGIIDKVKDMRTHYKELKASKKAKKKEKSKTHVAPSSRILRNYSKTEMTESTGSNPLLVSPLTSDDESSTVRLSNEIFHRKRIPYNFIW